MTEEVLEQEDDTEISDPSGIVDPIENDPKWFKENQDHIPCFKFAWDGVYNLQSL